MLSPEKNDVNVSRLFHWGQEYPINDKYGNFLANIWMRLVGDADLNRARVFAIRKSAELRKKLRTEDTDERIAFISTIYEVEDKGDLVKLVSYMNTKKLAQDAASEVKLRQPKEPKSTATLEEQEKYQLEVDSFEDKRSELINSYVFTRLDTLIEELKEKEVSQLQKQYERLMIDELCEKEMVDKFRDMCVYLGVYKDDTFKEKYFETFDDFDNLPTEIKEQLIGYYNALEINVQELKKLLEVTQ